MLLTHNRGLWIWYLKCWRRTDPCPFILMTHLSFNNQKDFLMLTLNMFLQTLESCGFFYTTLYILSIHTGVGLGVLWAIGPHCYMIIYNSHWKLEQKLLHLLSPHDHFQFVFDFNKSRVLSKSKYYKSVNYFAEGLRAKGLSSCRTIELSY